MLDCDGQALLLLLCHELQLYSSGLFYTFCFTASAETLLDRLLGLILSAELSNDVLRKFAMYSRVQPWTYCVGRHIRKSCPAAYLCFQQPYSHATDSGGKAPSI